jgi:hypothetical protein
MLPPLHPPARYAGGPGLRVVHLQLTLILHLVIRPATQSWLPGRCGLLPRPAIC